LQFESKEAKNKRVEGGEEERIGKICHCVIAITKVIVHIVMHGVGGGVKELEGGRRGNGSFCLTTSIGIAQLIAGGRLIGGGAHVEANEERGGGDNNEKGRARYLPNRLSIFRGGR